MTKEAFKKYKTLGQFLKKQRLEAGLTLRQVEELYGISNPYISQLENGKVKNPSFEIILILSNAYEFSLALLLDEMGVLEDYKYICSRYTN